VVEGELCAHFEFGFRDCLPRNGPGKLLLPCRAVAAKRYQRRGCPLDADSGLQSYIDNFYAIGVVRQVQWNIKIAVKPLESARDDADDRVILVVQLDGLANCCRAAAVVALPEVITQDGHAAGFLAGGSIVADEFAPDHGRHAEVFECVRRDFAGVNRLRKIFTRDGHIPAVGGDCPSRTGDF